MLEQARCDTLIRGFGEGEGVPHKAAGESLGSYRKRIATLVQKHSPSFARANLYALRTDDATTLDPIISTIYAEAETALQQQARPGRMHSVTSTERGREVTRFYGDPMTWMSVFMGDATKFGKINRPLFDGNAPIPGTLGMKREDWLTQVRR